MEGAQIHPLTLRFRSRELESEYRARTLPETRLRTAVAVFVVLVLYSVFALIDPWIIPEAVREVRVIRIAVAALCLLLIGLTRTRFFDRADQWIILSLPLLGDLGILLILGLSGETGRLLYYAGLILAVVWTMLSSDLRFLPALGASVYPVVGYEALVLRVRPMPLPVVVSSTFMLVGALLLSAAAGYAVRRVARVSFLQSLQIEQERQRSEALLLNILPKEVSEVLKTRPGTIARRYEQASILFADIVGFTTLSARMGAEEVVEFLNRCFSHFDSLVEKYGLEKIRTIGDNYMVVAGVPRPCSDHAHALARMALDMRAYARSSPRGDLELRIGISTGPVVAGVIGRRKFQYDVWGDAVNTASRMESHGVPGRIQITRPTYELIRDDFVCEARGPVELKNMGPVETWFLLDCRPPGRSVSASAGPAPA